MVMNGKTMLIWSCSDGTRQTTEEEVPKNWYNCIYQREYEEL